MRIVLGRHQSKEWWKALANVLVFTENYLAVDYKKSQANFTYQVYEVTESGELFLRAAIASNVDLKDPTSYPHHELPLVGDLRKYLRSHATSSSRAMLADAPNTNQNNPYNFPVSSYRPDSTFTSRKVESAVVVDCIQEVWTPTLRNLLDCALLKTRKELSKKTGNEAID